mmetsp:Transcript_13029/g.33267  ORF Transcript_13029/g.33267 Transcript_13029/m.33267 type:complete len:288 (+) Transcript_13029:34-897(+)
MGRPAARPHGLAPPFHPLQVASWGLFASLSGLFYLIVTRIAEGGPLIAAIVVHTTAALLVAGFTTQAAGTDSRDTRDYQALPELEREALSFCHVCQSRVRRESKHCRICDKCVDGFDHHCIWLNNCIGAKNYASFFKLLASAAILLCVQSLTGFAAFVAYVRSAKEDSSNTKFAVLVGIYVLAATVAFGAVMNLLLFHIRLVRSHQTTYDYIVEMERRKRMADEKRRSAVVPEHSSKSGSMCCFSRRQRVTSDSEASARRNRPSDNSPLSDPSAVAAPTSDAQVELV